MATEARAGSPGNDRLLFGMILGVLAFWLFAQTTLNIASTMAADLGIRFDTKGILTFMVAMIVLLLMPTNVMIASYKVLAVVAFSLFGLGLAVYATPSTDAALANLPDGQAGSGSGIYKMASSLGASFGVAISAAIFTALSASPESANWIAGVITFAGRQDNLAAREAAFFAFGANLLMIVAAIVSILLLVPAGKKTDVAR